MPGNTKLIANELYLPYNPMKKAEYTNFQSMMFLHHDTVENFMNSEHPDANWGDSRDIIMQMFKDVYPEEFI